MIECPNCHQLISADVYTCPNCNALLGIAAAIAEREVQAPYEVPLAPEVLVPRIGEYLLQEGVLNEEQLQAALGYQAEARQKGKNILLGQALLELGFVDRETLDQAITIQILKLHAALKEANQTLLQRVAERTKELHQALTRLSELSQLKANFIANISHELRTPLTHLRGYLEILNSEHMGALNAAQKNLVSILLQAENRLETLIDNLIQFSLATRGELQMHLERTELAPLARATLQSFGERAREKNLALIPHIEEPLPAVRADAEKIQWILQQLVDNALKFTPENGEVRMRVYCENNLVNVSVCDTGIGIPEEQLESLFTPFHPFDRQATAEHSGTGLSLAMAQQILAAHGTQLHVESKVGHGSCFTFTLPAYTDETIHQA